MPPVEGLTPEILWYTLIGIVGIGTLIILADKVLEVFRKKKEREKQPEDELADVISQKVLEKLEPRFREIDRKLANDKLQIEDHTAKLSMQKHQIDEIEEGQRVMCRGVLAILSHMINGNSNEALKESQKEITDYLITK